MNPVPPACGTCIAQAMYEQAVRGEQPGLMLMQDKLGGDNVENSCEWLHAFEAIARAKCCA